MQKYEKEIKVLNIDVDEIKQKLLEINATFIGEKNQKIYVYDVHTVYYRFLEIKELLKSSNKLITETNLKKLEALLIEVTDLVKSEEIKKILNRFKLKSFDDLFILSLDEINNIIADKDFEKIFKNILINPNKWIRLRQSNEKIELTTKHVFNKNNAHIQKVLETEIKVSSFEDTNKLLEGIGLFKRSYQEKIRISYEYKGAEIEIDIWPMLEPYLEIECQDDEIINQIINLLDLKNKRIVSLNTETLYKEKGINVHEISELKF